MRPDYAKEIARRALTSATVGDISLLTEIATYCVRELGYHQSSNELVKLLDELRVETEEAA